jgi:quercetin dioxygenase-like cupin family protein
MTFEVRRVMLGHTPDGDVVVADGRPPHSVEAPDGTAVSDLFWVDGPPAVASDGGDPPEGGFPIEPPPSGFHARIIRLPAPPPGVPADEHWLRVAGEDPEHPGMHATDTLDFMIVLDGEIVLGMEEGERRLGPGDAVVQRGTMHRWRVVGDRPCTFVVAMLRTAPDAPPPVPLEPRPGLSTDGPRRVVTGVGPAGRSIVLHDGPPPIIFGRGGPNDVALIDLWQTGGAVSRPDQGGDIEGTWQLDPEGRGVAFRMVHWPPGDYPADEGWHATESIDVDVVLSGHLELGIRGAPPIVVGPGEFVVLRGAEHRWRPVGDEAVRMAAVMLTLA